MNTISSNSSLLYRIVNDKETRSVALQVITLALLFAFFFYIIRNAAVNLETIGKGYSFKFLWDPSNYDINQTLIEYNSRSPHWRATIVGMLNTFLVATTGIIIATFVGFILGVLRLSHNWLINKVVYAYIEYVRNVPAAAAYPAGARHYRKYAAATEKRDIDRGHDFSHQPRFLHTQAAVRAGYVGGFHRLPRRYRLHLVVSWLRQESPGCHR